MAKTKIQKYSVLHFAFIKMEKKDFVTASSASIFMFKNSGSELLPTVLSAAALQPSALPGDLLSVTRATPHLDSLSHKRLDLLRPLTVQLCTWRKTNTATTANNILY